MLRPISARLQVLAADRVPHPVVFQGAGFPPDGKTAWAQVVATPGKVFGNTT
jgi:hypothetical protein